MTVAVCAIAKNENNYINEWVNWYVSIGFDHIYLFDNNDVSTEFVGNFIENKDFVTIFDVRGIRKNNLQHNCYNHFYRSHANSFDWCLFCDIDEFLWGIDNIKDFLSKPEFKEYSQIRITWKTFSDDNIIDRDLSVPVYDTFKTLSKNKNVHNQTKSIVRGNLENISVGIHRSVVVDKCTGKAINMKSCLPSGAEIVGENLIMETVTQDISKENVFINHYRTKSLKEFIDQKLNRGDACSLGKTIDFDYYWISNDRTEEKEKFIREYLTSGGDETDGQQ